MRFKQTYLVAILLTVFLLSCERVIDSVGPTYMKKAVLTGLLQPDSLIRVQLTYSGRPNEQSAYEAIENAVVLFYENGQRMEQAKQVKAGLYEINTKPTVGNTYRVIVDIPGYGRLEAEDVLPNLPKVVLRVSEPKSDNPNGNPDFTLSWKTERIQSTYWLSAYVRKERMTLGPGCPPNVNGVLPPGCSFVNVLDTEYNYIVSNSLYPDRFDAYYDSFAGGYLYKGLLRFNPDNLLSSDSIEFSFTLANQFPSKERRKTGEGLYYDFMIVGPNYDRYLKTSVQAYQNRVRNAEDALNNPFAEVTPVFSNVRNGLGVFGALSRARIAH